MTIGIALIGAGRIGRVHAGAIGRNPDARLVAVSDPSPDAAAAIVARHGGEARALDRIEAAGDVDAVVICSPTDTHAELIERFARAGKAVFCEKPVDLSVERVRGCLRTVEAAGVPLMIGFNRRFDPHFRGVRQAIADGRIGEVEMVQIVSRDPSPPPAGYIASSGGIFRDMTIHDFDMARFLLGEEPVSVCAIASVLVDPAIGGAGDFDSVSVLLATASGRHCAISNSRRAAYGYDQRVEVHGSKGVVLAENQRPVDIQVATAGGYTRPPLHDFFMTRYAEAYAAEMSAFVLAVKGGAMPSPDGADGLAALLLAEAALQSVAEKRVVSVNIGR